MGLYFLGAYLLGGIIFMCRQPKDTFNGITLTDLFLTIALWPVWAGVLAYAKRQKG